MDDQFLHTEFSEEDELPVPVPDPQVAWNNLLHKLERSAAPVPDFPVPATNHLLVKGLIMIAIPFSLLISTALWIKMNHQNSSPTTEKSNTKAVAYQGSLKETIHTNNTTSSRNIASETDADSAVDLNASKKTSATVSFFDNQESKQITTHKKRSYRKSFRKAIVQKKKIHAELNAVSNANPYETFAVPRFSLVENKTLRGRLHPIRIPKDEAVENEVQNNLQVQAGLQWNLTLPVNGLTNYFAGPNTKSQLYRYFLPGFWLGIKADRSSLLFELNPFMASVLKSTPYLTSRTRIDSITTLSSTSTLNKIFGFSAGLSYDYHLKNNWWVGGGLQTIWWKSGVMTLNQIQEKNGANNTVEQSFFKHTYAVKDNAWSQYFTGFQLFTNAELVYRKANWEAGYRIGISFEPLTLNAGAKNNVQSAVFFRLPLLGNKKRFR